MNTFAVSFLVRPSKANKAGESPIELSLCINAERTYINLPRKVKPSLFDCKKQIIKGRSYKLDGKSSVSCPLKPSDSAPLKHSTMPP